MKTLFDTYRRLPIAFTHGQGAWLYDTGGKRYLDALSGIAVNTLGHAHPKLVDALREQAGRLIHSSNLFESPLQEALGNRLSALLHPHGPPFLSAQDTRADTSFGAFFCNSGLEANETAIKIAKKFGRQRGIERPKILVFERAFHGRSIATLSASSNPKIKTPFAPLLEGFVRIPLGNMEQLQVCADSEPELVALFMEPIQGEGGVHVVPAEQLQELRAFCDKQGWLLMFDEIQCGVGRTGRWFYHDWAGIRPDVISLAKGLGSGVPIGAVLAKGAAKEVLGPGDHGSTFGGNLLAMRAGLATLSAIEDEGLLDNAQRQGDRLIEALRSQLSSIPSVVTIRGRGLMVGIELDRPCEGLMTKCLEAGLVVNVTAERVIRLLPPLIFQAEHVDFLLERLVPTIRSFLSK